MVRVATDTTEEGSLPTESELDMKHSSDQETTERDTIHSSFRRTSSAEGMTGSGSFFPSQESTENGGGGSEVGRPPASKINTTEGRFNKNRPLAASEVKANYFEKSKKPFRFHNTHTGGMVAPSVLVVGRAVRYILEEWMRQSGAVYERLSPKFFRMVVKYVSESGDNKLNNLKLTLLKQKTKNQMDPSLTLMKSINVLQNSQHDASFVPVLFKKYNVADVAVAVTFVMHRVFRSVGPSELHDNAWQGKERSHRAPHLHALSLLFNRLSFLCVVEILFSPTEEERDEAFAKCAELANSLKKMGNFEGMAAVTSVFGNCAIQRAKPLWRKASRRVSKKTHQLEQILNPAKNYASYWGLFNTQEPPLLPWFAPKLRELRFMYDGNPKTNSDGTVDYSFLQLCGKSINEYLQFKAVEYSFGSVDDELIDILERVMDYDLDPIDDALYAQSVLLFPK